MFVCSSLCELFTEPTILKVRAKLEENSKSHRNCRCATPSWLAPQTHRILSSLGSPSGHSQNTAIHSHKDFFQVELIQATALSSPWPSQYLEASMHSTVSDLSCYITMYSRSMGQEEETVGQESLTTLSWLICFLPTLHPFRVSPHNLCTVHLLWYSLGE